MMMTMMMTMMMNANISWWRWWPAIDSTECSSAPRVLQLARVQVLQLAKSWPSKIWPKWPWLRGVSVLVYMRRTFEQSIPSSLGCHQEVLFGNCLKDGTKKKNLKTNNEHRSTRTKRKRIQKKQKEAPKAKNNNLLSASPPSYLSRIATPGVENPVHQISVIC